MSDAALHLAVAAPPRLRLPLSVKSVLVALMLVVGLVASGSSLLGDPDTQWHIAVGRQIWAAHGVPVTDNYSYTFAGAPWIAKEWLSQLILFAAYEAGAWRAVVIVTALAVGVAFALLHEYLLRRVQPTAAFAMTCVALILAMPHFLARPHILVLPVIVAWMVGLVAAVERDRVPPLPLAFLMTLWANMHGSFPLGLVMAGLLALESIVRSPRPAYILRWALFLAVALAATLLTPYGWHALLVPLRMPGNGETLRYVNEWQPLHADWLGVVACGVLAASLVALARGWRGNLARAAALLLLGCMMARYVRFISLFGVLAPILVARALGRWPGLAAKPDDAPRALWGAAAALLAAALVTIALVAPAPEAKVTPEAAYQAAVAAGATGPVYNDYDFGGFLIAHGVKTFVDGRTDQLFLGDFLPGLMRALKSKRDDAFAALLARYHVAWALVRTGSKDAEHLAKMPGWTRVHGDDVAIVFVRSGKS